MFAHCNEIRCRTQCFRPPQATPLHPYISSGGTEPSLTQRERQQDNNCNMVFPSLPQENSQAKHWVNIQKAFPWAAMEKYHYSLWAIHFSSQSKAEKGIWICRWVCYGEPGRVGCRCWFLWSQVDHFGSQHLLFFRWLAFGQNVCKHWQWRPKVLCHSI